jgi:uncharacterized protein (DUF2249 family)
MTGPIDFLWANNVFAGVPARDLEGLAARAREHTYRAPDFVFSEGEQADWFCIVREGRVSYPLRKAVRMLGLEAAIMDDTRGTHERTIEELKRRPGATEVFERFDIHHCCGGHLSLHAAAAAAGVPVTTLVEAMEALPTVRLDVRGLEPPQPLVRILERVATLGSDDVLEAILNRRPLLLYPQLDDRGFTHDTDEREPGVVRVRIRRRPT